MRLPLRLPLLVVHFCLAAFAPLLPSFAVAQMALGVGDSVVTEHVQARLVANAPEGVVPGKPLWLGLSIKHAPHWHTYWKNPGDSGLPTTLKWTLPPGFEAGEVHWPTPKQLPVGPLLNYGYEGELLLPVSVTVPAGFSAPVLDIQLRAEWLVCSDVCIPESGNFALQLPANASTGGFAKLFSDTLAKVPPLSKAEASAKVDGQTIAVEVRGLPWAATRPKLKFFSENTGVIEYPAPIEQKWDGDRWSARVPLTAQRSESPERMQAVLVGDQPVGVQIAFAVAGPWPDAAPAAKLPEPIMPPARVTDGEVVGASFVASLGLALLGGLLLNLMPCVFPVLSLKLLGFAKPGQDRRALLVGGLAYTAGVVLSFVALAALLLALRAGGEQLGWGFQLQSPVFVAALAVLFTLIGLNLAGVYEIGGVLTGRLAGLESRHPVVDHLLTGAVAVAIASPCTGPFMGAALGTALSLPVAQAIAIFVALGLGMALPYLAVSALPDLARHLPRPGVWMVRFRSVMAFPMFATVVWLVWVLGQQVGIDGASALLGLLLAVAFAAWAWGSSGFGPRARWGFGGVAAVLLAATLAWALPALRSEPETAAKTGASGVVATGERWQAWSPDVVAKAVAQGRPVFVDFTAAWCVTCQYNKRTTLNDAEVLADFDASNVLLLRADWTRRDPAITQELTRLQRSGVPVYALYAPGAAAPILLPELLRVGLVRQAIASLKPGV
jgi:thiol:disulfide interchange protein DsbD